MNFLNTILSLILFFIALGVLITIHELGHFIAAKSFKVYCSDFSIGFGPKIVNIKRKNGETNFKIGVFPVGGYVSMYGEEVALTIPYLYDETYHDGWDIETLETSIDGITWTPETIRVFESSASATSDYLERYAALLLENGYEEVEDNVYEKGIVRITFGATLLEGFTFTKVSE